ncbi:DUF4279 domain-containing protein [Kitasatospora sp. NPDC048365]|uniref:DUF4279 domain-containing protein n=1 Tax=Kitasatospora sp. NPDC048365 TaxID=3364050 RepID=UPI00371B9C95
MPLHQYAYFALFSRCIPADEITSQLCIAPDEVSVRGSRFTGPRPIRVDHSWKIVCREPGLRVDEQITCILDRLRPHTARIAELAGRLTANDGGAVLQVVRYFNDTDLEQPSTTDTPNLFGWHLDRAVLDFLTTVGAELDVDEYDMTDIEAAS